MIGIKRAKLTNTYPAPPCHSERQQRIKRKRFCRALASRRLDASLGMTVRRTSGERTARQADAASNLRLYWRMRPNPGAHPQSGAMLMMAQPSFGLGEAAASQEAARLTHASTLAVSRKRGMRFTCPACGAGQLCLSTRLPLSVNGPQASAHLLVGIEP